MWDCALERVLCISNKRKDQEGYSDDEQRIKHERCIKVSMQELMKRAGTAAAGTR